MLRSLISVLFVAFCALLTQVAADAYTERLHLRPLPRGSVFAGFNFESITESKAFESQNFQFFPRSLAQILQHSHTKELHLRFSSGRWDDRNWGPRSRQGRREGGTGVELWAWVEADTEEEANASWLTLTNALSGLFCASLNFVDATRTIRPVYTFEADGWYANSTMDRLHLLHGTLPGEVVCTENLTPFLKLLPCKGKAGVSSLLDGHKLFDSIWQTMAIDVSHICPVGGANCDVVMESTIDMVLDIERSTRPRDDPIPRPQPIENITCDSSKWYHQYGDVCLPAQHPLLPKFSLEAIFGRPLKGDCPLAFGADGTVCVDTSSGQKVSVQTTGKYNERKMSKTITCYNLPVGEDFDLQVQEVQVAPALGMESALYVERSLTGRGQQRGGISTVLTNPSADRSIDILYLESLPWFMKPYIHTVQTHLIPLSEPDAKPRLSTRDSIMQMFYRPAVDRQRATHLELNLTIPASTTLRLTYEFDKAILRYTEYPPDANRGFNVAPAIVRILTPPSRSHPGPEFMRTTPLLLYLPTPDFSMPYNVIILTSTVIALGFGSIYNILVRRFVSSDEAKALQAGTLKGRLLALVERLRNKFAAKGKTE